MSDGRCSDFRSSEVFGCALTLSAQLIHSLIWFPTGFRLRCSLVGMSFWLEIVMYIRLLYYYIIVESGCHGLRERERASHSPCWLIALPSMRFFNFPLRHRPGNAYLSKRVAIIIASNGWCYIIIPAWFHILIVSIAAKSYIYGFIIVTKCSGFSENSEAFQRCQLFYSSTDFRSLWNSDERNSSSIVFLFLPDAVLTSYTLSLKQERSVEEKDWL